MEDKIFDILDGLATDKELQEHSLLLKTSKEYATTFHAFEQLHLSLANLPFEEPSSNFNNNILKQLGVKTQQTTQKLFYFFIIFLSVIFIGIIALIVQSSAQYSLESKKISNTIEYISSPETSSILLIINMLLILLVLDKKVLQPFFEKRRLLL